MSIHPKKLSMDNLSDNSDILSILESIETMFEVCRKVHNSYTQASLMLSITTEAEMLLLKLRVMQDRWKTHLPFKEASTIDFYRWATKIEQMAIAVGGTETTDGSDYSLDEYCPSKHYLLDLYECLDESPSHTAGTPYYAENSVSKFIADERALLTRITRKWNEYTVKFSALAPRALEEHLGSVYASLADRQVNIRMTCHTVLRELYTILYDLYDTPKGKISAEQFSRLASRVIGENEYGGPKVMSRVEHDVNELKNNTPEDQWESRREGEIKTANDLIKEMKLGSKVFSFLGRDKTMSDNPSGLGRFLWSVRNIISKSDLSNLIEMLYRIAYLTKDREQQQQAALTQPESPQSDSQPESKDAYAVYCRRRDAKPQKPLLPKFFNEKLATDDTAVERFYEILHHCGFYIGRTLLSDEKKDPRKRCYEGWKWSHLREAFVRLGFFRADSSKKGFAEFLADVFPDLTATNIQRGFNSRGGYVDSNAVHRILQEMTAEFETVANLMRAQGEKTV